MKTKLKQKTEKAISSIERILSHNTSDSPEMSNSAYLKGLLQLLLKQNKGNFEEVEELVNQLLDYNSTPEREMVLGEGFALGINELPASHFDTAPEELVQEANRVVYEVMSDLCYWRRLSVKPFLPKSSHEIDLEVKGLKLLGLIEGEEALNNTRFLIETNNKAEVFHSENNDLNISEF